MQPKNRLKKIDDSVGERKNPPMEKIRNRAFRKKQALFFFYSWQLDLKSGPHVPRPPLALGWRTASRPLERRGLLECAAMPTGLSMYTQLNTHPYPSVQTVMHSSGSQNRRQPPPAKPVHAEKHKPPAGGAHNKLSWSPSGDTSASPTRWRQYRAAIREFFQGEAEGVYDCTRPKQRPPERLAGASEIAAG